MLSHTSSALGAARWNASPWAATKSTIAGGYATPDTPVAKCRGLGAVVRTLRHCVYGANPSPTSAISWARYAVTASGSTTSFSTNHLGYNTSSSTVITLVPVPASCRKVP